MEKTNIILFNIGEKCSFYQACIKHYADSSKFKVSEFSSVVEAKNFIDQTGNGVFLFHVEARDDLKNSIVLLKAFKKLQRKNLFKSVCVTDIKNKKVENILARNGCLDFVETSTNFKTLNYKLEFWGRPISNAIKTLASKQTYSLRNNNYQNKDKKNDKKDFEIVKSLENVPEDFWILKSKFDYKKILKSYLVRILGPSPHIGKWHELEREEGETLSTWKYVVHNKEGTEYITESGAWFFVGAKPEFDWKIKRWIFSSVRPHLYFYNVDNEVSSRFFYESGTVKIAENSKMALSREEDIFETCSSDFSFAGDKEHALSETLDGEGDDELESGKLRGESHTGEESSNSLSGDLKGENDGNNPLSGKGKTDNIKEGHLSGEVANEASGQEPLSGRGKTDNIKPDPLSAKTKTDDLSSDPLAGDIASEASGQDPLSGRGKTDNIKRDPLSAKTKTEDLSSDPLAGDVASEARGQDPLSGRGKTDNIKRDPLSAKTKTEDLSSDPLAGDIASEASGQDPLSGRGKTDNIKRDPLSAKTKTEDLSSGPLAGDVASEARGKDPLSGKGKTDNIKRDPLSAKTKTDNLSSDPLAGDVASEASGEEPLSGKSKTDRVRRNPLGVKAKTEDLSSDPLAGDVASEASGEEPLSGKSKTDRVKRNPLGVKAKADDLSSDPLAGDVSSEAHGKDPLSGNGKTDLIKRDPLSSKNNEATGKEHKDRDFEAQDSTREEKTTDPVSAMEDSPVSDDGFPSDPLAFSVDQKLDDVDKKDLSPEKAGAVEDTMNDYDADKNKELDQPQFKDERSNELLDTVVNLDEKRTELKSEKKKVEVDSGEDLPRDPLASKNSPSIRETKLGLNPADLDGNKSPDVNDNEEVDLSKLMIGKERSQQEKLAKNFPEAIGSKRNLKEALEEEMAEVLDGGFSKGANNPTAEEKIEERSDFDPNLESGILRVIINSNKRGQIVCELLDLYEQELTIRDHSFNFTVDENVQVKITLTYNGNEAVVEARGIIQEVETEESSAITSIKLADIEQEKFEKFIDLYEWRQENISNFIKQAKGY